MINCQSCKIKPIEIIEPSDNEDYSYQLCKECHHRLINQALRPLEYFNLAAKHGMTGLLHDDIYDEDGEACQPLIKVKKDKSQSFPEFKLAKNNIEQLIDYSIVQWWLSDDVVQILKKYDKRRVLNSLIQRINENRGLGYRLYEIAAKVLGSYAGDWVREEWNYHNLDNLYNYAECLAYCLPLSEGFYYYTDALITIKNPQILSDKLSGLIYFQSDLSLDWIEKNIKRVKNISSSWGYVAAASKFDWKRVKKWIDSGRPLSLVAFDALVDCSVTPETKSGSIWLKENPQKLLNPETIEEMDYIIIEYLAKDNVARVRNRVEYIRKNWDKILK